MKEDRRIKQRENSERKKYKIEDREKKTIEAKA